MNAKENRNDGYKRLLIKGSKSLLIDKGLSRPTYPAEM